MLSNLPFDLVDEILARVPTKYLVRLRSTCKRWNSLFDDYNFSKKHFNNATKQSMNIFISDKSTFLITCGLQRSDCYGVNFCKFGMKDKLIYKVLHCDGLLLCLTACFELMVWNPCLNQTKLITAPNYGSRMLEFDFGCDKKSGDCRYKILAFIDDRIEMYDFTSKSWRILNTKMDFRLRFPIRLVSLKGNSYCVAADKNTGKDFVLRFDYSTEMFGRMSSLPFLAYPGNNDLSISVKNDRISILYEKPENIVEIWMTGDVIDGQQVSWSKLMTVDANKFGIRLRALHFFIHDEENKVVVVCDRNARNDIVCVIEEERYTEAYVENAYAYRLPILHDYVPSLVHIR